MCVECAYDDLIKVLLVFQYFFQIKKAVVGESSVISFVAFRPDGSDSEERGCRFFGLTHPSVQNVLQACPGARKCSRYKWIKFEVSLLLHVVICLKISLF